MCVRTALVSDYKRCRGDSRLKPESPRAHPPPVGRVLRLSGARALPGQKHLLRPLVGGQPVFNLGALWEIAPVAGEEEALEFGGCEG